MIAHRLRNLISNFTFSIAVSSLKPVRQRFLSLQTLILSENDTYRCLDHSFSTDRTCDRMPTIQLTVTIATFQARWSRFPWGRHQMETFSAYLAICAGNSSVTGEFPAQRPVTRSFDVFFDLRLKKWLSKQWWGWWSETPSRPLWRHCNGNIQHIETRTKWQPFSILQILLSCVPGTWITNRFLCQNPCRS